MDGLRMLMHSLEATTCPRDLIIDYKACSTLVLLALSIQSSDLNLAN